MRVHVPAMLEMTTRSQESHQLILNSDVIDDINQKPWLWCITIDQLIEIGETAERKYGSRWYETASMYDIVEKVVKPICARTRKGYWASMNPNGLQINAFITHSWHENFKEFVASVRRVFRTSVYQPNLWICAFALFQGNYDDLHDQISSTDILSSPFVQALKRAESFVIIRNPLKDLYSRVWCVCELMIAMENGLVPNRTFIEGCDTFADCRTSCIDAEASVAEDKIKILKYLFNTFGGVEEVDKRISEFRAIKLFDPLSETKSIQVQARNRWARRGCCLLIGWMRRIISRCCLLIGWMRRIISRKKIIYSRKRWCFISIIVTIVILITLSIVLKGKSATTTNESELKFGKITQKYQRKARDWLVEQYGEEGLQKMEREKLLQKYSLATLYYSTTGPLWSNNNNWIIMKDECSWYGVECSKQGNGSNKNNVVKLDLFFNNLNGTIPVELAAFTMLTHLDLSRNALTGTIPTEIGRLTALEGLELNTNQLTSGIPSHIGKLTKLRNLGLGRNKLSGTNPTLIGELTSLTGLYLNNNKLTGSIPRQLDKLTNLQALWLYDNDLSGSIPEVLCPIRYYVKIDCGKVTQCSCCICN